MMTLSVVVIELPMIISLITHMHMLSTFADRICHRLDQYDLFHLSNS